MKQMLAAAALTLFSLVSFDRADALDDPGPPFDLVAGTGISTTGLADSPITVFARETSDGPTGHFTVDESDGHFEVKVTAWPSRETARSSAVRSSTAPISTSAPGTC